MAYSIGIWRQPGTTVYRWESDYGGAAKHEGFVRVYPDTNTVRPSTQYGDSIGDLILRSDGVRDGSAEGVDPNLLRQIALAILRKVGTAGELPETAHKYYG